MKSILVIAAGVMLAGMVGWATYDTDGFRHTVWGYSQTEQNKAWLEYQTTIAQSNRVLDDQLLESEIRLIALRHGEATASRYRLCHTYPPTAKSHKLECERLDKQKLKDDASDAKHPW